MTTAPKQRMTVDDFLPWVETQDSGRYELIDGTVVALAPGRAAHVDAKFSSALALKSAIQKAGVDCHAYVDGLAVVIDENTSFEPDALVNCGPRVPADSLAATNPVVVLEVLSPSTKRQDSSVKLKGYFKVPSIMHYVIVDPASRVVVAHQRRADGGIATTIVHSGELRLDPPGISVPVTALFE